MRFSAPDRLRKHFHLLFVDALEIELHLGDFLANCREVVAVDSELFKPRRSVGIPIVLNLASDVADVREDEILQENAARFLLLDLMLQPCGCLRGGGGRHSALNPSEIIDVNSD